MTEHYSLFFAKAAHSSKAGDADTK